MATHDTDTHWPASLPTTPVRRWTRPLVHFLRLEAASGVVLLACTAAALVLANSPYGSAVAKFWHIPIGFTIADLRFSLPLDEWINDGLMAVFFFVVGLEIKREIVLGELREMRKAALPILGAVGGMLAPALIYLALVGQGPGHAGWGIPMATDIAFVVGFLALLGPRVPFGLKIFLLSLAIADDIGAVLVIAVFYTKGISLLALGAALAGFVLVVVLNIAGVRNVVAYWLVGGGIWLAVLQSGVHPTVAGVLLGLLTPARAWIGKETLTQVVTESLDRLRAAPGQVAHIAEPLALGAREAVAPSQRLEHALHPWVSFAIMPIFALANAGVVIDISDLRHPVTLGVTLGLLLGKPIGIVGVSWLGVKLGLARLPAGVSWKLMLAGACLGGIGFTMSLFITGLAFDGQDALLDAGKVGTLIGSACSAVIGSVGALFALRPKESSRGA